LQNYFFEWHGIRKARRPKRIFLMPDEFLDDYGSEIIVDVL
jgi:hypothetical protein